MLLKPKYIVFFSSFFLYSGFYIGLLLLFGSGFSGISRYYTIPVRVLLLLMMLYYLKNHIRLFTNHYGINVLVFFLSVLYLLKAIYSDLVPNTLNREWYEYVFYFVSYCMVPFFFFSSLNWQRVKPFFVNGLISSGLIFNLVFLFEFNFLLASGGIARLSLLTQETGEATISPLAVAYSGALTIIICLYQLFFQHSSVKKKLLYIGVIIMSFVPFFIGATRGALLAIVLCTLVFLYYSKLKYKIWAGLILIASLPLLNYLLELTGSALLDRTSSAIEEGNASGRQRLWQEAFAEFINYPFLGGRIEVSGIYPHNIYLETLMATGVVGFILFIIIHIKSLKKVFQIEKKEKALILSVFLFGFALYNFSGGLWMSTVLFTGLGLMNNTFSSFKVNKK